MCSSDLADYNFWNLLDRRGPLAICEMKDKQFVIATLLLLVGLYMIRCTLAKGPLARFLDIIKVPQLDKRLENIILRMQNSANPGGALDNSKGDDTTSGNSPQIPGLTGGSSAGGTLGGMMEHELSSINQVVGNGACRGPFAQIFNQ